MYPILILRTELVCLIILVFLQFTSRAYSMGSKNTTFNRILFLAIGHVLFDAITVYTVNHLDTVPAVVNLICHLFFYITAILFSNEMANYVITLVYPNHAKLLYALGHILTLLYMFSLAFLEVDYVPSNGTNSSSGMAAYVGYSLAFSFFIVALVVIFTHYKKMPGPVKTALVPMLLILMVTEVSQVIWKQLLFTGGAVTIVTVGFFFSLENPVEVFKKKAMTDALTGVHSRSSFEEDIDNLDKKFKERPNTDYIFVFCDLNDLRKVNNRFGHTEGDNYITLIASAINSCMKRCSEIYRIGGDEFLILYNNVNEEVVKSELAAVQEYCRQASEKLEYTAAVSAGYAQSSASYKSLREVVKTADYAMYQNKAKMKNGHMESNTLGTTLNYAGLTDILFDAVCASNDKSYLFITNLDTNVTRIDPAWKEFFGLDSEFYYDFLGMWKDRIQPSDLKGYMEDVVSVISGHKKYHNYDYFARKADGEYVKVSCNGSVYQDSTSGISYFSGFIINYGVSDNIDKVTGLENFDHLQARICKYMDDGKPFSVLKIKIRNFARVNMLCGYNEGNEVLRKVSSILCNELGDKGQVYCQNAVNFSLLFNTSEEWIIENFYNKISAILGGGVKTESGTIPLILAAGAIANKGTVQEIDYIRSGLVFALEESQYSNRNEVVFYHDSKEANVGADIALLADIHADARTDMQFFKLRYQPIVEIASGKVVGAEALIRWIHPIYGEVQPEKFIAFLENDPCYYRLGLLILEQSILGAKELREAMPTFRVNVNVTALQLQNENFLNDILNLLEKHNYDPKGLVLELTERCKEMNDEFLAKRIAELRAKGILIAFDDLGTGYSTISLLMNIPVDEIKLDKNFVRDIRTRENYQLFVRALVLGSTSPENKYNICFEGIEDEDTRSIVSLFGNFLAQGYFFSKPLFLDEMAEYLDKNL